MNKFWTFCAALMVAGVAILVTPNNGSNSKVSFRDLETECRVSEEANVDIYREGKKLVFEGHYPEKDSDADLSYNYRESGDRIVLNVKSRSRNQRIDFFRDCLASVVYSAQTTSLEPGIYEIVVKHDGVKAAETSLRVPN